MGWWNLSPRPMPGRGLWQAALELPLGSMLSAEICSGMNQAGAFWERFKVKSLGVRQSWAGTWDLLVIRCWVGVDYWYNDYSFDWVGMTLRAVLMVLFSLGPGRQSLWLEPQFRAWWCFSKKRALAHQQPEGIMKQKHISGGGELWTRLEDSISRVLLRKEEEEDSTVQRWAFLGTVNAWPSGWLLGFFCAWGV